MLQVKEIFGPTIQGEGAESGMPAIFIRFAGCNMWNGKPETRARSMCPFCDTDFQGGTPMTVAEVLQNVAHLIPPNNRMAQSKFLVVLTGGEPLLQPPADLIELCQGLHKMGHITQLETNGTVDSDAVEHITRVTVSPKLPFRKMKINWFHVDCLKILHPHPTVDLKEFLVLSERRLAHDQATPIFYFLQPIDESTPEQSWANVKQTVQAVKNLGLPWRLSLQTHKILGEQ